MSFFDFFRVFFGFFRVFWPTSKRIRYHRTVFRGFRGFPGYTGGHPPGARFWPTGDKRRGIRRPGPFRSIMLTSMRLARNQHFNMSSSDIRSYAIRISTRSKADACSNDGISTCGQTRSFGPVNKIGRFSGLLLHTTHLKVRTPRTLVTAG